MANNGRFMRKKEKEYDFINAKRGAVVQPVPSKTYSVTRTLLYGQAENETGLF